MARPTYIKIVIPRDAVELERDLTVFLATRGWTLDKPGTDCAGSRYVFFMKEERDGEVRGEAE